MAFDQAVARRRPVQSDEVIGTAMRRRAHEVIAQELLHAAAQHAAAHEPEVDDVAGAGRVCGQHADQAVVAEAVGQAHAGGECIAVVHELLDLRAGHAQGREVELVALVDELGDAIEVERVERADHGLLIERAEVRGVVGGGLEDADALRVRPVLLGALPVLGADGGRLEKAGIIEQQREVRGVLRQLQHVDLGQRLAHVLALERVVIDEHDRAEPDVQLGGNGGDVLRLAVPVGPERDEVVAAADHVGTLGERP